MKTVVIIGAGASGLACASTLSKYPEVRVIVLEQYTKTARKLLASGNGRCNLSNRNMKAMFYNTNDDKIQKIVQSFDAVAYFNRIGLLTRYDGDLLYPYSNQAITVKNVLLHSLNNVVIKEDCQVLEINQHKQGYLIVTNTDTYDADFVVYATGSKAGKLSGENNLDVVKKLGVSITKLYPSLVQLQTNPCYPQLKGVRTKARVSLFHQQTMVAVEEGEVLFNEIGVSGICVMQLSRFVHQYEKPLYIHIDLLPDFEMQAMQKMFGERARQFHSLYFEGIFNEKLAMVLDKNKIHPKEMILEVVGTNDYTKAQVMSGGVALDEVNDSLECLRYPGLFIVGEALDVDGDCGGYNLHFAFASGNHVAETIGHQVKENVTN
jgi:predicted Rossmann fold flavoprotein